MNLDVKKRYLDQAERALPSSNGGRRQSETSFLQRLLRELGHGAPADLSPAGLFRAALHNGPLMRGAQDLLRVLAGPSQRPTDALRAGDWMLRAVPGTGDVGHVSVLASDLLTQSMLASEGIAAESVQPGYYGLVIEAGVFPHSRVRPFARRLLDSRGRVPPNTVFLRPEVFQLGAAIATPEVALPVGQGGRGDIEASPSATLPPALPSPPVGVEVDEPPEAIDPSAPDLQIHHLDPRVDVVAKFALQRMIKRPDRAVDAARLIRGINGGTLAGIFGENLPAAAKLAQKLGTVRWELVPKGEDAALILDPEAPMVAPPTIIFRVKEEKPPGKVWPLPPERMDPALQKASRTFELWQRGELGLCATSPSAIPVPNLVPPSFCRLLGRDLLIVVTEAGTEPGLPGPPVPDARVQVEGPSPSKELTTKFTGETGQARFPDLAPGSYRVTASKQGFEETSAEVVLQPTDQVQTASFAGTPSAAAPLGAPSPVLLQIQATPIGDRIKNVRILALHFLNDHGVMRKAPSKTVLEVISATKKVPHTTRLMDDGPATAAFVKPDWTASKSNPISQTKNTKLKIQIDIEFELVPGPQMQLQGMTSVTKDKFMEFEAQFDEPIILKGAKTVVSPVLVSKNRLPNQVGILEGGEADWVLHIDGKDFHPIRFQPALRTGPHKIFVTLGEPTGAMERKVNPKGDVLLDAAGDKQVITDARLEFSCSAAKGAKTAVEAADAIFRHIRDVEKVRYRGGFKWSPKPENEENDTAVEPKPARFHDYLWLCNKNIAAGECHFLAAAFVLAVKVLGAQEEIEVGLMFPWPRRVNTLKAPDRPGENFPFWPPQGFSGHRFQGRYQKMATPGLGDPERYFRTHEDFHAIDAATGLAIVERIRFRDSKGFGNGFEAVVRLDRRLYAIGESNGILEANDANFPGFSSLSEKEKLHASATLFYAVPGNLNRGVFDLFFIDSKKIGSNNTTKDPDKDKCPEPYPGFSDPHFRWES